MDGKAETESMCCLVFVFSNTFSWWTNLVLFLYSVSATDTMDLPSLETIAAMEAENEYIEVQMEGEEEPHEQT